MVNGFRVVLGNEFVECFSADADVDSEDAFSIEVGDAVVVVVGIGDGCKGEEVVVAYEVE